MALLDLLIIVLAIVAGDLQIVGYTVYIAKSLKENLEPNPSTWLMFAYGTAILSILEFDRGANWAILFLPTSCAILAIVVALICWKKGKLRWPENKHDQFSFLADVFLTICYIGAWCLYKMEYVSAGGREKSALIFLVCSNLTTLTSFYPLLRETREDPRHENALPWTIWMCAYLTLGVATYLEYGLRSELMIYPVLNALLHGLVAWLSRPCRQASYNKIVIYR